MARAGLLPRLGLFQMFVRTLEYVGAQRDELQAALRECRDLGPGFVAAFRRLGDATREAADRVASEHQAPIYFRAALYYLVADWATHDDAERRRNYALAMPCHDAFRARAGGIEKVGLPFERGPLSALSRTPPGAASPVPAVLLIPGNDEAKEWMLPFEEAALARGLATLSLDLPGYGENGLAGQRLASRRAMTELCGSVFRYFDAHPGVDAGRVGVFGVSLGGLLAPYLAGLEPRIAACAGLGGPYDLDWELANVAHFQVRRFLQASGLTHRAEAPALVAELRIGEALERIACPCLVVHGASDEVVPVAQARALAARIGSGADLRIVPGGDHMCSQMLRDDVTPRVFDWLAEQLAR